MSEKIKILHVLHGLPRGGLENGVVNLLNNLPCDEFEQAVCCLDVVGEMAERIKTPVEIHFLKRKSYDFHLPIRLAKLINQYNPHIVHCRNWNTWFDTTVAHLLTLRKGKLVWSFHGFADGTNFPLRRSLISNFLARVSDRLFAVCKDSAQRYAKIARIPESRFDVVYNGVDCDRFRPSGEVSKLRAKLGFDQDDIIATTVASLTPVKDHMSLIHAVSEVISKEKNGLLRFILIGEGSQRRKLEAEIRRLNLKDNVLLVGNKDNVPDYLAISDYFILPSVLEGMSNAIMEAMACGLPVIANNVGGNPELIRSGQTGILCIQGDSESMADAIRQLANNKELREKLGAAARDRAEEHFSIATMMSAYANYYKDVARLG